MANPNNFFKKGNTASKGKPKGTYSQAKKRFIEIQQLAGNDANKTYESLKAAIERGESWAHQIYWKELYRLPKNYHEESVEVVLPQSILDGGIDEYLKNFVEGLAKFESYTKDEICSITKTLANAKTSEVLREMFKGKDCISIINLLNDDEVEQVKALFDLAEERSQMK